MIVKNSFLFLLLFLSAVCPLVSYEGNDWDIYLRVTDARASQPPRIMEDNLILIYKPPEPTRFIGVAFGHEDFTIFHPLKINEYGVFFLVYPLPWGEREITYRFVADGLWMPDPTNTQMVHDSMGVSLSLFPVPEKGFQVEKEGPHMDSDGRITFGFRASPGEEVYLAGSFNHWDPFMYRMQESPQSPGHYKITLLLNRGTHYYNYLYQGLSLTDPKNLNISRDAYAREVSVLHIP